MADEYTYQKRRKEFGRYGTFEDTDTKIVGSVPPDATQSDFFITRDPNKAILSNIPNLTAHGVNTDRIPTAGKGMKHQEGGWPGDVDPTEPNDIARYDKKMYRDTTLGFSTATRFMSQASIKCIQ
jgi:dynein intermediate chain 2